MIKRRRSVKGANRKPSVSVIGTKGYPFVYSGYETFIRELTRRLKGKYDFHIYCHRSLFKEKPEYRDGLYLHYVPALETKWLTHVSHDFLSLVHALYKNFDLYFFVNVCNGPLGYLTRMFRKPTVINTDGMEWERPQIKGIGASFYHWSAGQAVRTFDTLVSDSQAIADAYKKEWNAETEVIAYGADIFYGRSPELIERYGLKPDEYYFVIGRLIPSNNADLIIKEFQNSRSSKKLVITGDLLFQDTYATKLKEAASDKTAFTGFVRDTRVLRELYANAFCYVHGHECGGTNPTLLQALGCGCCVMALDTLFSREVLNGQEYGMFFNKQPGSLAALFDYAENNVQVVDDYRKKSRNRIENVYNWDKIAAQYEEIFDRMLKEKGPAV